MFVRKCNGKLQRSGLFAKQLLYWRKEENCTGQDGVFTDKTYKLFARLSRVVRLAKVSFAIIICATQYFFVRTGTGVPNPHEIMSRSGFTFVWCGVMALIVSRNISSVIQLCCGIISLIQCNFKKIWNLTNCKLDLDKWTLECYTVLVFMTEKRCVTHVMVAKERMRPAEVFK